MNPNYSHKIHKYPKAFVDGSQLDQGRVLSKPLRQLKKAEYQDECSSQMFHSHLITCERGFILFE
ncbi:hypothetical protein BpHYR1_004302 [Brachionus plicatilis]|uniref:Uncharacterized protein n=1 Tax=Brachionus plicatilis TaxID=10195 RepID=A0A3M7RT88_BRAPC|nr:hypothetical protein BpHYR1_004302 [Brachionus plicatilis]